MPKITQASELDDQIEATVEFEDGFVTSVHLPTWANKGNIIAEAARLRAKQQAKDKGRKVRSDLVD